MATERPVPIPPAGRSLESCRSCGKPIFWVESKNKTPMPLDARPLAAFTVDAEGKASITPAVYGSHFATCPQADRWRKKDPK